MFDVRLSSLVPRHSSSYLVLVPLILSRALRRLVLFDIDGTILTDRGASRSAFAGALEHVFGYAGDLSRYDFSGRTDPQIAHMVLRDAGTRPATSTPRCRICGSSPRRPRAQRDAGARPRDVRHPRAARELHTHDEVVPRSHRQHQAGRASEARRRGPERLLPSGGIRQRLARSHRAPADRDAARVPCTSEKHSAARMS
jgi:beta-phosphoglucomutase-like phosphatase (HAD superfamily)